MRLTLVLTFLLPILYFSPQVNGIGNTVDTTSGMVEGVLTTFQQKPVYQFRMVPYAEPPIGELRFKAPVPKAREPNTIDGTKDDYVLCPQDIGKTELEMTVVGLVPGISHMNESCLFLDVYVPETATAANRLPVMFWIHGGGYTAGGGRFSTGLVLAALHDVIVVTINYRLGALGFFTTGDSSAEGDFGLQDQILALNWVNNNIEAFGGDKSLITLAGESAGGASVAQLTIAPKAKGLFKRAIIQSGGLDNPWACSTIGRQLSMALAQRMNCKQASNRDIVQCLRSKTAEELLKNQSINWSPACSGVVLPYSIQQLQTSAMGSDVAKTMAGVDILMGLNAQEGALVHETFRNLAFPYQTDYFEPLISTMLPLIGVTPNQSKSLLPALKFLYTDWARPNDTNAIKEKLIDYSGDIYFNPYPIKYKQLHSAIKADKKGSSYFYQLKRRPSWMKQRPWRTGADHGDDLFFVFGDPLHYSSLSATPEEQTLSRVIMTYWTNFIKTGDPNSPITEVGGQALVLWPPFNLATESYLVLDVTMNTASVARRMFPKRTAFWNNYVPAELERLRRLESPKPCPKKELSDSNVNMASILITALLCMVQRWLQ